MRIRIDGKDIPYPGWRVALVCLVAAATLLFFPAGWVYFHNVFEFRVGFGWLWPIAFGVTLLAACAAAALVWLVPRRLRASLLAVLVMVAIAGWIQGNLLVRDYGVVDGTDIALSGFSLPALLDVLAWPLLIGLAVVFTAAVVRHAALICIALLGIQAFALGLAAWQAPTAPSYHRYHASLEGRFSFSGDRNVVVLILDAFQSDVFQQILENHPGLRRDLDGFTYFRNAVSGYSKTYPTPALLLSGQWYENREPLQRFLRRILLRNSLPVAYRRAGWDTRLYPLNERTLYFHERIADNFEVAHGSRNEWLAEAGRFLDFGVFRVLPHVFKPWWLNRHRGRMAVPLLMLMGKEPATGADGVPRSDHPHRDVRLLENMLNAADTAAGAPAFRLYHLMVPHAPFMLNEDLEMERLPDGRKGFYRHSVAAMNLVVRFLERLRELEIYDDTYVLVLSDHGGGEYGSGVRNDLLPDALGGVDPDAKSALAPMHHASGLPLILAKPFGRRGVLETSDAPVSLADVPDTLAAIPGPGGPSFGGRDLFAVEASEQRSRRYLFYQFEGWADEYLPEMTEYRIEGHSWLPQSWISTGRVWPPPADDGRDRAGPVLRPMDIGEQLGLGRFEPARHYLGSGWANPSKDGAWSVDTEAELTIPLRRALDADLRVGLRVLPFTVTGVLPAQNVRVHVNGIPAANWRVADGGWYEVEIPVREHAGAQHLRLRLELPDAASPADHLKGPDVRTLGLFLYGLRLGNL